MTLQDLLAQEAQLGNSGKKKEQEQIHVIIILKRGHIPPSCWGEDDCSSNILLTCPWRIDCGDRNVRN